MDQEGGGEFVSRTQDLRLCLRREKVHETVFFRGVACVSSAALSARAQGGGFGRVALRWCERVAGDAVLLFWVVCELEG